MADKSQNKSLIRYALMQGIKESSTLKMRLKGGKLYPKVVYRWGKQDGQVKAYLKERRKINKTAKSLSLLPNPILYTNDFTQYTILKLYACVTKSNFYALKIFFITTITYGKK